MESRPQTSGDGKTAVILRITQLRTGSAQEFVVSEGQCFTLKVARNWKARAYRFDVVQVGLGAV